MKQGHYGLAGGSVTFHLTVLDSSLTDEGAVITPQAAVLRDQQARHAPPQVADFHQSRNSRVHERALLVGVPGLLRNEEQQRVHPVSADVWEAPGMKGGSRKYAKTCFYPSDMGPAPSTPVFFNTRETEDKKGQHSLVVRRM
jgi:uncharacterized membrane protein